MSNSEMLNFFTEQGRTKDRRLCRDVLPVRRRQKPAENAAQRKNCHLWMDTDSCPQPQFRGFAPIGMLECWSAGIMGTGIMECWVDGRIRFHDKIKMDNILLKTNIPVFHHSIIPYVRQKSEPQKTNLFSKSFRISETFN